MAGFSGFTDEDIRRFKMQGDATSFEENTKPEPIKKAAINSAGKRSRPREKIRTKSSNSKPSGKQPDVDKKAAKERAVHAVESEPKQEQIVAEETKVEEKPREVEVVMEPEKVKELELSNLEKMQQKQKEMEMINKKKEKMLQTAVKQRYAKTKRETETLKLVQKELNRLDNLLYTDVQILRDKIDNACREFEAARRRYERAEAEFINAKVNLHDKTEAKDQLTEHLCSIIQQNEERKAKKLSELMARLELADEGTNLDTNENVFADLTDKPSSPCSETISQENKPINRQDLSNNEVSSQNERTPSEVDGRNAVKEDVKENEKSEQEQKAVEKYVEQTLNEVKLSENNEKT